MASLPKLPGLPGPAPTTGGGGKGNFAQGFVDSLTKHVYALIAHRDQLGLEQRNRQHSIFETLARAGAQNNDFEMFVQGMTGLIDPKAGAKMFNAEAAKSSPIYQQAQQLSGPLQQLLGGQGGQQTPTQEGSAALPAQSAIPQGSAAPAADQGAGLQAPAMPQLMGASPSMAGRQPILPADFNAETNPPFVSEEDIAENQVPPIPSAATAAGSSMAQPPKTSAPFSQPPAPAAPGGGATPNYDAVIKVLSDPSMKWAPNAQQLLTKFKTFQVMGTPFEQAVEAIKTEMLPVGAAITRTGMQQTGATERAGIAADASVLRAQMMADAKAGKPVKLQLIWQQPRPGGPKVAGYVDPFTNTVKPLPNHDGTSVIDSAEFRQQVERDERGNEYVRWVLPGGFGGAQSETGLGAPPGAAPASSPKLGPGPDGVLTDTDVQQPPAGPKPTRAALALPKITKLKTDFDKNIKPYHERADTVAAMEALKGDESGPAQMNVIYNFIKNLDRSVVRPSEYETIKEAQAIYDRWQTLIERGLGSDILVSPELVKKLQGMTEAQYAASAPRQAQVYLNALQSAEAEGVDPKRVITGIHPNLAAALRKRGYAKQLGPDEISLLEAMQRLQIPLP